jgi:shikimate kinase
MRIFLAGISDVGKTTVGGKLAALLDYRFFDLDAEIQRFYQTPIERLQNRYSTVHQFRVAAARVLKHVLARGDSHNCVIALPPSGLMGGYWKIVKTTQAATIIVLRDTPENILRRITFYDIDSRPLARTLTDREKSFYRREITGDIAYFRRSFQRAHIAVDIAGCSADEACRKVKNALTRQNRTTIHRLSVFPAL